MADVSMVPAKQGANDALIAVLVAAARDQSIKVEKLVELVTLQERIMAREAEIAFNVAMNEAQGEMSPIVKDAKNSHAGNRYATLEQVDREVRPIYAKHGFCLTFNTASPMNANSVHVTCEVRHAAGHKKEYFLEGDLDVSGSQGKSNKTSIQGLGSSVSYLRRYLTLMIFNLTLTNEDNDGNGNRGDKPAYDAMRHAADAKQAARQAVPQVVHKEPIYEAIPEDDRPVFNDEPGLDHQHAAQLQASVDPLRKDIKEFGVPDTKRNPSKFQVMGGFSEVKKLFKAIKRVDVYYRVLGENGVEHSNQFPNTPEGIKQARECYKEMSLAYGDALAETKKKEPA